MEFQRLPSSFRDPSGFVFELDGRILRQVAHGYREDFELLTSSGLYGKLVEGRILVAHQEVSDLHQLRLPDAYKVLVPERIPFVSYPYEWCFSELKDAALLTLSAQRLALEYGMVLKDASAFNVQFLRAKPILIDTLSFERYHDGQPWIAYRQFCQHFLAPLALMALRDIRLNKIFELYIGGVPLDLARELLPWNAWINPGLAVNIMMHAKAESDWSGKTIEISKMTMTESALKGVLTLLENTVQGLKLPAKKSTWSEYYEDNSYSPPSFNEKQRLVQEFLDLAKPATLWDLGANTGKFSRVCGAKEISTIAFDADSLSVEQNYSICKEKKFRNVLPLVLDLTAPTPAIGWANEERLSIVQRGPADAVLALALIHHLAIANNVPLPQIAQFFKRICRWLIIEFVPKEDPQTQSLLAARKDIFGEYSIDKFEEVFRASFEIRRKEKIEGSRRTLYLMEKKDTAA